MGSIKALFLDLFWMDIHLSDDTQVESRLNVFLQYKRLIIDNTTRTHTENVIMLKELGSLRQSTEAPDGFL